MTTGQAAADASLAEDSPRIDVITQAKSNMKCYVNTARYNATPMSMDDYNTFGPYKYIADDTGTEGYLVEALDGYPGNHPDFVGAIFWLTTVNFDKFHSEVREGTIAEHEQPEPLSLHLIAAEAEVEVTQSALKSLVKAESCEISAELDAFRATYFPNMDPSHVRPLIAKNTLYFIEQIKYTKPNELSDRSIYALANGLSVIFDQNEVPLRSGKRIYCSVKVNDHVSHTFNTSDEFLLFLTRYNPEL